MHQWPTQLFRFSARNSTATSAGGDRLTGFGTFSVLDVKTDGYVLHLNSIVEIYDFACFFWILCVRKISMENLVNCFCLHYVI